MGQAESAINFPQFRGCSHGPVHTIARKCRGDRGVGIQRIVRYQANNHHGNEHIQNATDKHSESYT